MIKTKTFILTYIYLTLFLQFLWSADCCPDLDDKSWSREHLTPGVELLRQHFDDLFGAPQFVNVLSIDLQESDVMTRFATAKQLGEDRMTISELGAQSGAISAINGGFGHGGPEKMNSGILKIDSEILPFLKEEPDELHFVGGSAVGFDAQGMWLFRLRNGTRWEDDWEEVEHALAGGHMLISKGEIYHIVGNEVYVTDRETNHAGRRHPRTAIGLTSDSTGILITVDGRHPSNAEGMTLRELALFMQNLGCVYAINLDGGGSTTMWTSHHGVVNHPSGNQRFDSEGLRALKNGIIILAPENVPHY